MADNTDKVANNVDGAFYVDSNCIDCDLCRQTAPDNFARNEDDGYSFVSKQPEISPSGNAGVARRSNHGAGPVWPNPGGFAGE